MPASRASSSPRRGSRGGPERAPVERGGHQLAGELQVRVDGALRVPAARGEPVGARQERHLDLDGRGAREVAVDRAAVERPLVHEEAEHQVMPGHGREEAAEPLARAQAPAHLTHHLLTQPVVPQEGHAPVIAHVVRGRLADVVEQRTEAERLAARELVRQRLVEHLAQVAGGLRLQLDQPLEHLERVPVDVLVVVVALLDVVEVGELGQDRVEEAEPVGQREARDGARREHQPAQLREHSLAGRFRHAGAASAVSRSVSGSGSKPSSAAKRASRSGRSGSLA